MNITRTGTKRIPCIDGTLVVAEYKKITKFEQFVSHCVCM